MEQRVYRIHNKWAYLPCLLMLLIPCFGFLLTIVALTESLGAYRHSVAGDIDWLAVTFAFALLWTFTGIIPLVWAVSALKTVYEARLLADNIFEFVSWWGNVFGNEKVPAHAIKTVAKQAGETYIHITHSRGSTTISDFFNEAHELVQRLTTLNPRIAVEDGWDTEKRRG